MRLCAKCLTNPKTQKHHDSLFKDRGPAAQGKKEAAHVRASGWEGEHMGGQAPEHGACDAVIQLPRGRTCPKSAEPRTLWPSAV